MNKKELYADILELVNSNPLCEVDINPIILKYTNGKDFEEQKIIRNNIFLLLSEIKKEEDITFNEASASVALMQTRQGSFPSDYLKIKSTIKYEKERSKIDENKKSISIQGDNSTVFYESSINDSNFNIKAITKKAQAAPHRKLSVLEIGAAIAGILATAISIYELFIKKT